MAITHNDLVPHARDAFSADPLDPLQRHHLRLWIRLAGDSDKRGPRPGAGAG